MEGKEDEDEGEVFAVTRSYFNVIYDDIAYSV
jgi:hypothetical protein